MIECLECGGTGRTCEGSMSMAEELNMRVPCIVCEGEGEVHTLCDSCDKADKTCPVFPQNTVNCIEYVIVGVNLK